MPHEWNNILVTTKEELVPNWFSLDGLQKSLSRYKDKPYGIKRVQLGGHGRQLLISFDSLPVNIQEGLGDPRKVHHILERFYKVDGEAVAFFASFRFPDGTYLETEHQEKYITNASVLKAIIALRSAREMERSTKGGSLTGIMSTLCADAVSFQQVLKVKHRVEHTLPESNLRFKQTLKAFEASGFQSLISAKHKNSNSRKVTDETLELLNNMFSEARTKPTATDVARKYNAFLSGYLEVINNSTGELYNPKEFKKLSHATVTNYMSTWVNKIGTHAKRSGDRQKFMQQFKPHHSLLKPKFAGSIISIDDRQPPFKSLDGKRVWFYNGIDLGSEAFTTWVYGREKEGIILDFYRQMIRNYADYGMPLPAELEAEMSLNSSFVETFLKPGAMFEHVRIEANNARGKRIEAYFKPLRYELEKKREGWLARPFAERESNQAGPEKVDAIPYDNIINGCLKDIETWNNMPHSVHTHMSRWDVFMEMQHPDLKPTNYQSILPYLGYMTKSSVNVGIIRFRGGEFLLAESGKIATGEKLINLMKQVEGNDVQIHWLDNNQGGVLKALVFIGSQFICEAMAKPTYSRAKIEQTPQDLVNREIMSSYVATIESFGRTQKRAIEPLTIIDNTPQQKKSFIMPGLKQSTEVVDHQMPEILPEINPEEDYAMQPSQSFVKSFKDRF